MRRRDFITVIAGLGAVWPLTLTARAQQPQRMRRIGAFLQELQQLGWSDGRNVRIDTRWAAGDANLFRKYATELVTLAPDVILAPGSTDALLLTSIASSRARTQSKCRCRRRLSSSW